MTPRSSTAPSSVEVGRAWAATGRQLPVPGADTAVWESGNGPAVLCVHGVPASAFLYRKVLPHLGRYGLRGVAVDLPGLGFADRPKDMDYSWSGLGAWLHRALDALELDRVHLVLHDIGWPVGLELTARCPERIASMTLLDTVVRVATFRRPWAMEPFARRGIGECYLAATRPWLFERLMRQQGVATPVPAAELRAYVHLLKRGDGGRAFLQIMRSFERTPAFERRITSTLQQRRFPAQVIWGEDDPALPIDSFGEQAREVLGVERVLGVPGKHFVAEDSPELIARHVAALAAQ